MHHPLQVPLRLLLVLLLAWTLVWTTRARADLFTDARSATSVTLGQADTSGVSLRSGVNLRTFLPETSATLFQTQATVGGSCGAFDFTTSLTQALETIPDLFANLIQALLGSMPMLVLCYTSPTLCDLAKHFQSLTNLLLQARFGQCQTLQTTMAATGLRLRSGQSARCLEDEQQQGTPLNVALERCLGEVNQLRNPFGLHAGSVELVQETLEAAGVDPETVTLARQMLGEVTLTAGGSVFGTQQQRPPESLHRRYEQFQQTLVEQLREASATLAAGGTLPEALLQELSLPGQPLPRAALNALADLQADPVRHESLLQQLAAGLAINRLTWEVGELHTTLAAAETVNAQLTDAERRLLEQRLAALQQELTRVQQEKETAERHLLPVVQALLRSSSLRLLPAVIVIVAIFYLLGRGGLNTPRRAYAPVIGYVSVSTLILVLFWPEAVGRLGGINSQTSPHQVASYAATQDAGAVVFTAQATRLVPEPLQAPILLPTGLRLLLRAFTETHLELAKAINSQTHRTFAPVVPMQWLLTQKLSGEAQAAVRDFVHGCYLPAKVRLLQRAEGLGFGVTFQELLPWGASDLQQELAQVEVTPGAQTGLGALIRRFLGLGGELPAIRCDAYILTTVQRVIDWLVAQHTQRGTPLGQVFQQELGLTPETQAQFLLYREMLRAAGPEVPAPNLTGVYLGLRGVGLLGSVARGAGEGGIAGGAGAAIGAKLGVLRGAGNELQRILEGISSLVGMAVFLTWWGPYILGMVNLVVLGLFPIVAIWFLFPQAQFRPLATYFAVLFFTTASPLWWALVDGAARLAHSAAQGGTPSLFSELVEWGNGWVAYNVVTALGILLIPVVTGLLIFGSWRAIGGLWRGAP